jgi:hypothetical protein
MLKSILKKLSGSNTLYYPGCVTQYALPEVATRYETLLRGVAGGVMVVLGLGLLIWVL